MHKIVLPVIFVTSIITLISCEIIDPFNSIILPGRRDYTWSITEINPGYESLYLVRIWGSSPDDVWAIGVSSWTPTCIWHYNGVRWKCDSINTIVNPASIFGFSNNQVWLGNSESAIWKYDGTKWFKYGIYTLSGFKRICTNYFDGQSTGDIYCVGFAENDTTAKAIIMHWDSLQWKFINIPNIKVSLETIAIELSSGVLIMSGTVYNPSGYVAKIYSWDGQDFKELASEYGWSFVTKLGDEIYATLNSKIYKYSNKELVLWKDNTGIGINSNIICGRSMYDFFMKAQDGITHYNGTDFMTLYKTNLAIQMGTVFEKDVFLIGYEYTTGKNYIIHGKLN